MNSKRNYLISSAITLLVFFGHSHIMSYCSAAEPSVAVMKEDGQILVRCSVDSMELLDFLSVLINEADKNKLNIPRIKLRIRNPDPADYHNICLREFDDNQIRKHGKVANCKNEACGCHALGAISVSAEMPFYDFIRFLAHSSDMEVDRLADGSLLIGPEELLHGQLTLIRDTYLVEDKGTKEKFTSLPNKLPPGGAALAFDPKTGTIAVIGTLETSCVTKQLFLALGLKQVASSLQPGEF